MRLRVPTLFAAFFACIVADGVVIDKSHSIDLVIPIDSSLVERHAVEELQGYIESCLGVHSSVVEEGGESADVCLYVGETQKSFISLGHGVLEPLGSDGYRIRAIDGGALIVGSKRRGVVYGVYGFLEKFLGVRWYAVDYTLLPRAERVEIAGDTDIVRLPAFAIREAYWYETFDADFSMRLGYNADMFKKRGFTKAHGGNGFQFGGSFGSVHTFYGLLPTSKYYDAHPEYYSLVDGVRIKSGGQLCLSNSNVVELVASNLMEEIDRDVNADFFSVSQNDNDNYCQCQRCREVDVAEGSHAGQNIRFVNAVADRIVGKYPNVNIVTLAYRWTQTPCATRPRQNVYVQMCPIKCDMAYGIGEGRSQENVSFLSDLERWGALTPNLLIWDYTTNFRNYLLIHPNLMGMHENLRTYHANKVGGIFAQGGYQGTCGYFSELKAWLLGKWMWDPAADFDVLVIDFLKGYYGSAWPFVWAYVAEVESRIRSYNSSGMKPLTIYNDDLPNCFDDQFFNLAEELWLSAEGAVRNDPERLEHVRKAMISYRYSRIILPEFNYLFSFVPCRGTDRTMEIRQQVTDLVDTLAHYPDIRISEMWTTLSQYERQLRKRLRELHAPAIPIVERTGTLEDGELLLIGENERVKRIEDTSSMDGSALEIYNFYDSIVAYIRLDRVETASDKRYKVAVRCRMKNPTVGKGAAFTATIRGRTVKLKFAPSVAVLEEGYQWFVSDSSCKIDRTDMLCIAPTALCSSDGSADQNVLLVDNVSLVQVDE